MARPRVPSADGDFDVPGVEGVLVEAEADEAVEVHVDGPPGERESGALWAAEGFEGVEEGGVGGQAVRPLSGERLGVPVVPDAG